MQSLVPFSELPYLLKPWSMTVQFSSWGFSPMPQISGPVCSIRPFAIATDTMSVNSGEGVEGQETALHCDLFDVLAVTQYVGVSVPEALPMGSRCAMCLRFGNAQLQCDPNMCPTREAGA